MPRGRHRGAMAQSRSAEDLLLLGQPQEALKTAREALKSSASSGLGAGAAAAAAVQAARALGNIDEAGKALHSAFGTNFASLPSEALVLWCASLALLFCFGFRWMICSTVRLVERTLRA